MLSLSKDAQSRSVRTGCSTPRKAANSSGRDARRAKPHVEGCVAAAMSKPTKNALAGRWISIEYEDKNHKAKWYKGLVKNFDCGRSAT